MKRKAKELEGQITQKDTMIAKMREKTSDKAQDSMKDELKRAYDVLRHLKKKIGVHAFNEEYGIVINEIREALQMPPLNGGKKRFRKVPQKAEEQTSPVLMAE